MIAKVPMGLALLLALGAAIVGFGALANDRWGLAAINAIIVVVNLSLDNMLQKRLEL